MSAARTRNRTSGALLLLLVLLLLIAATAFAGVNILQVQQLEYQARASQLEALRRRLPPGRAAAPDEPAITVNPFLGEESFALSANALQKRVVALVESANGKLNTVGVDPPITGDAELSRRVSVQVSAELTNDGLQRVLHGIESAVPFAFVETLSMAGARTGTPDKDEPQSEPRLSVSMSIVGYRRKEMP
jgi:hypothetical protein